MPHSIRSINYPVITTHHAKKDGDLFEIAFHNAAIGMAMVKPDGQWIKVNPGLYVIYWGIPKKSYYPKNLAI